MRYLDVEYLPDMKAHYRKILKLSQDPTSYKQIEKIYQQKWKEQALNVKFWTEDATRVAE